MFHFTSMSLISHFFSKYHLVLFLKSEATYILLCSSVIITFLKSIEILNYKVCIMLRPLLKALFKLSIPESESTRWRRYLHSVSLTFQPSKSLPQKIKGSLISFVIQNKCFLFLVYLHYASIEGRSHNIIALHVLRVSYYYVNILFGI